MPIAYSLDNSALLNTYYRQKKTNSMQILFNTYHVQVHKLTSYSSSNHQSTKYAI